ncbi:polysaccharide biosynthesis/export family protein [Saccharicrinis aurantiacus]|uniref:polysaccharide biosynthesis/export family protein n=1 Tax=Saccharicrinis aurantiacus TaxID=1849719 RepID=UPI0024922D7F|nr:SLBB domain-containing protein [Saccharicrinis aurantiacus]
MKFSFLIIALSLALSIGNTFAQSSNIDPSSVNVDELSDDQIREMVQEIEARGLSDEDAIAIARMKGATSTQVSKMMMRIQKVRAENLNSPTASKNPNGSAAPATSFFINESKTSEKENFVSFEAQETYGYQLFNTKNLTFEPSINIPTPSNYIIGIGDQIDITIWGASQTTYQLPIDINGQINIPDLGLISVYGKTFDAASKLIKQRLQGIYSGMKGANPNTFSEISLGALRSIKVNVIGEVNVPGTYSLPATATAFNALYLSGGPNKNGSFRNISIIRNGKSIKTLDVYNFLLNGDLSDNINLKEDDIIYVSSFISKVRLQGAFKNIGLFETLPETTLDEVIKIAGGFSEEAFQKNLKVIRKTQTELEVKTVDFGELKHFTLKNGDEITAGNLLSRYENRVSIQGHVFRPGGYELKDGMTLAGLIKEAEGVKEGVFTNRGLITRLKVDNTYDNISFNLKDVLEGRWDIPLQREDVIMIQSEIGLKEKEFISVNGLVQKRGKQLYADNLTLGDVIFKAGGFKESADINSIEVSRILSIEEGQEYTNQLRHTFSFDVDRNLKLNDTDEKFILKPFDIVSVRKAPGFRKGGTVTIIGEVMNGGTYSITTREESISALINRSGGLTPLAYPAGAILIREKNLSDEELQIREEIIEKDSTLNISLSSVKQVGIKLDEILANPGEANDLILSDGDKIIIPTQLQTVKTSGNVMNPISLTYQKGRRAKYFIKQAGGYGVRPKRSSVYVIHANGISSTTKNYILFKRYPKVEPGSEIMVPQRPESNMGAAQWVAIASAVTGLAISITSLANILK